MMQRPHRRSAPATWLMKICMAAVQDGILGAIVIQEGGVANVGEPIAYVAESDAEEAKSKAGGSSAGNGAAPAAKEVPKQETAKVEAPVAAKSEAATATASPPPAPAPAAAAPAPAAPSPQKRTDGRIIATPYAKKLAKELGVDLNSLAGSGPAGRITASDVEGFKKGGNGSVSTPAAPSTPQPTPLAAPTQQAAAPAPAPSPAATSVSELKGTTQPFNALQAAVAKNMLQSLAVSIATASYTSKCSCRMVKSLQARHWIVYNGDLHHIRAGLITTSSCTS